MSAELIPPAGDQSGWRGQLGLRFDHEGGRTRLRRESGYGPLYVQKPFYPEGGLCHVYLLHPPGGIAGGDRLNVDLAVTSGAAALVTTPAAGKFYRSGGATAELRQTLTVAESASLEWLPQETLLFGGCRAELATTITLAPEARFIGWDMICLGRDASGDHFTSGSAGLTLEIGCSGPGAYPLLRERTRLAAGDPLLAQPWGLAGRRVLATLYATPVDGDVLEVLRHHHPARTGAADPWQAATRMEHLLVVRLLGSDGEVVRRELESIWRTLRPLVLQRPACPPRIWNT